MNKEALIILPGITAQHAPCGAETMAVQHWTGLVVFIVFDGEREK